MLTNHSLRVLFTLAIACVVLHTGCSKNNASTEGDTITSDTVTAIVNVDVSSSLGAYRDVIGVNKPPRGTDSQGMGANTYEVSEVYKALGISNVRLHDSQVDVSAVYSDDTVTTSGNIKTWACNTCGNINSTSNYNFTTTNNATRTTASAGASVFLRLGESESGANNVTNLTEYATAVINIYKHVIGNFSPTIGQTNVDPEYIELYNEPDGAFWLGASSDFYNLYNDTYDTLKTYLTSIGKGSVQLGGAGFTTTFLSHTSINTNVAYAFLTNATTSRLDFFSSHIYGSCDSATVSEMGTSLSALRNYMNTNGLSLKPLIISEWNLGLTSGGCTETTYHAQRTQSFNAGVMSLMQDTSLNIVKSHYYAGFGQMSIISVDPGNVGTVTVHPGAWAFKAHSELIGGTLLDAEVCDTNSNCLSGVNSKSSDIQVAAALVTAAPKVVLSNDTDANQTVQLNFTNWSGSASPAVTLESYPSTAVTTTAALAVGVYSVSGANGTALISNNVSSSSLSSSLSGNTLTVNVSVPSRTVRLVSIN